MNSNNSGNSSTFYGANYFFSDDSGVNWGGQVEGAGGNNSGDPATAISLDGRMYVGFIHSNSSQGVSYSENGGDSWTSVQAGGSVSSGMLDKNHLWIDNSPTSAYEGNVYNVWTPLSGANSNDNDIEFVRTTDGGLTYSTPMNISSAVNAGSHNQGCNVQTGPNGEVYVVWSIYDGWPTPETALGFAKSIDGGATFEDATRILENIKGIRDQGVSKNMRVNSFPSMSVDAQTGTIYVVWANIGIPETNTGSNISVYIIKSDDNGDNWSEPIRVNQGTYADGKEAYLPWITCDPETGILSVIYYDDRNVSSTEVETYVSNSFDGGETWEDIKVSDVAFTPSPLPGMAGGYMGDYLGIAARGSMVYPAWCDNRSGALLTYVSPFETNNRARPENLQAVFTNEETGATNLTWEYTVVENLQHFVVYRNDQEIGTTTDLFFPNQLPDYGYYKYSVAAMHDDGESSKIHANITWGAPQIVVDPIEINATLGENQSTMRELTITNNGELDLIYNLNSEITSKYNREYCAASGGGDEYISRVLFETIDNSTGASGYGDYTSMSADVSAGDTYEITIENGSTYDIDDLGIWVDCNQDGDFEDANEEVFCESSNGGQGTFNITIPDDILAGETTMRIRLKYSGNDCGSPCGTTTYGEVEDYTLIVNNWLDIENNGEIITPGSTEIINVTMSSNDLEPGTYTANLNISSNDNETPSVVVPVELIVDFAAPFSINLIATPQTICSGSSTVLHANPVGGTGSYTYTWTSEPVGFTSADAEPTVNPTENTTYFVEVSDGDNTVNGEVEIFVELASEIPNTPTGDTYVGNQNPDYYNVTSSNATSYEWKLMPAEAGSISGSSDLGAVNWSNDFTGMAQISVKGINDCGESEFSEVLDVEVYDGTTSIENLENKIEWSIYPNPTSGIFLLELDSELADLINIEIYSITGELVYSQTNMSVWAYNSMQIDMTNSQSGLYLVHITGKGLNEVKKLIVK